jgi:tetratricopeptide (TPR) repeat protein
MVVEEATSPTPTYVALADSALRYAADRTPKERQLIEAFHAVAHADFPRARTLYAALLRRDSMLADAWGGLGAASELDLTLRRDERGREYLPASPAIALRAYERALDLDASDHRIYLQIARLMMLASLDENNLLPAFREPPPGAINTVMLRTPARRYNLLLVGDSLVTVPAESLLIRYGTARVDSLRAVARGRARDVLQRWIAIAPDEGQAQLMLASLQYYDRHYDAVLEALDAAEKHDVATPVPFPIQRLAVLLEAHRFAAADPLADSINAARANGAPLSGLLLGALANTLLVHGRIQAAERLADSAFTAVRQFETSPSLRRQMELRRVASPLRLAAKLDRVSRPALASGIAEIERLVAAAPEGERGELLLRGGMPIMMAAASLGDTALLATWRARIGSDSLKSLEAWAAVVAGDRTAAARRYAAAAGDTSSQPTHVFALARVAEALGRRAEALARYQRLDSLEYDGSGPAGSDWALLVRSYGLRGAAYEAAGDTARARQNYRRFVDLWREADRPLQEERERALAALAGLDRSDTRR